MNVPALPRGRKVLGTAILVAAHWLSQVLVARAGEQQFVLRDYIQQEWKNELLAYPFSAPEGACDTESVTLAGPRRPVPVQLSEIELWPGSQRVKSAKLSFVADLAPLATDTYSVSYDNPPGLDSTPPFCKAHVNPQLVLSVARRPSQPALRAEVCAICTG